MRSTALILLLLIFCARDANAQATTQPPANNALATAAANVGIQRCLPALERLSSLAVQGARSHDVLLDWDRKRPDAGPVFSMIGMEFANGGAAMTVSVVPEPGGGCAVAAERIAIAPVSCESVAQRELADHRMTRLLPNFAVYTNAAEPRATVSLIDSPPGCLVIRRHVEFDWKPPPAAARR